MNAIFRLLVLAFVLTNTAFSQLETYKNFKMYDDVENPMYMHYNSKMNFMHIFGQGNDINGNGEFDEGDTKPVWRMATIAGGAFTGIEKYEFELNELKYPFKPGIDEENGYIYIPHPDKISRYNMTGVMDVVEIADIDADAVDVAGTHLLLATNHNENERGELQVYNIASGSVLQRVRAGYNFRDVKHYTTKDGNIGIALLSDLDLESNSSVIHYGPIVHMGSFTLDSVIIDNNASEIKIKDSLLVATGGETDGIHLLNLNSGKLTQHFLSIGSYNPGSSVITGNGIYTATTYGDVRKTDLFSGNMTSIIGSSLNSFNYIEAFGDEDNVFSDKFLFAADMENNLINVFQKVTLEFPDNYSDENYEEFEVGLEPINVFFDEMNYSYHVICKGYDANFNGVYEEEMGDEKPSWWKIEPEQILGIINHGMGDVTKIMDFEFGAIDFPYANNDVTIDNNNIMYIPLKNEIKAYSINTFDDYAEQLSSEIPLKAASVSYAGQYLAVSERVNEGNDLVKLFNRGDSNPILTVEAGENVAEAYSFEFDNGNYGIVIANSGNFAEPNSSTIQWAEYEVGSEPQFISYNVGNSLNDMDMSGNLIAFTLNGSHQIKLIDINEGPENMLTFNTGTFGWDGPRDVAVYNNGEYRYLYLTTYAGDIRKIDLSEGLMTQILPTRSKAEGIAVSSIFMSADDPSILAANISNHDYSSNNVVGVYNRYFMSVNEYRGKTVSQIKLYPNPTVDFVNIETDKILPGNSDIEIFNMSGELILSETINSLGNTQFNFSSHNLPSGYYLMRIINNDEIYTAPLEILK